MPAGAPRVTRFKDHVVRALGPATLAAILSVASAGTSVAYIGPSFMNIPGVTGTSAGEAYKNWIELAANNWTIKPRLVLPKERLVISGPHAPREGASSLSIAIDKRNPALPQLMAKCLDKTSIPEMTFAESSERARSQPEIGERPASVPEFYEYRLKDATLATCTVVPDAPEQSFLVEFKGIEWLNFSRPEKFIPIELPAAKFPDVKSGETKSFVVTWQAPANYVGDDQCPKVNKLPPEESYWTYVPKAEADKERAELAKKKAAISYYEGDMERRGPDRLNVCRLPGIVPDPGHVAPQSTIAHGFDLDGDGGTGETPPDSCKHPNYVSADGRRGIDNQYFTVAGCIPGFQGKKGFFYQYMNEDRRNGMLTTLIEISGIDDARNDDDVDITVFYSDDKMVKNADGKQILPDFTFRLSDKAHHTPFFSRVRGRIADGVITTETIDQFRMTLIDEASMVISKAKMRFQIMPDGSLKGLIGGYQDWRRIASNNSMSIYEQLQGFECPGLYHALRRAADGMKDPITGECTAISTTWDVEGVPAFLPPNAKKAVIAGVDAGATQKR